MYEILTLFAWLLGAVGVLFTATMYYTVVTFGTLVNKLTAITTAWGILRSLANMALLFAFVLMGIATILDVEQYGVKRLLPKLLIAAILLNFSLFITKSVIDIGDTFAVQFYKEINSGQPGAPSFDVSTEPISEAFMNATGLRSVYTGITNGSQGNAIAAALNQSANHAAIISIICFMGIILFTVTAFILLALTIMFAARAITLIFLMIVSPIGFIATAVPGLSDQGSKWWKALANNTLFAPIVLLCILISISMLQHGLAAALGGDVGSQAAQGAGLLGGVAADSVSTTNMGKWADLLLVFVLAAGFLVASLVAARQLSMMGANWAISASRKVVSAPFNAAGFMGGRLANLGYRNTVGRAGNALGNWYNAKAGQWQQSGSRLAKISRGIGLDEGIAGALKKTAGSSIGGGASFIDRKKEVVERKKETTHAAEEAELKAALTAGNTELIEKLTQSMNLHGLEETIKTSSDNQIAALAKALSPEKLEKLMGSKEVSDTARETMRHGRFGRVTTEDVKNMTETEQGLLAEANNKAFLDALPELREEQREALQKNKHLTPTQKAAVDASTFRGRIKAGAGANDDIADLMNSKQKGKLDAADFIRLAGKGKIDHNDLAARLTEGGLTTDQRREAYDKVKNDPEVINALSKNDFLAGQLGAQTESQKDLLKQILNKL